jgi:hypothetical protein
MEGFEARQEALNITAMKRSSGFRPVDSAENRENEGSGGMSREGPNERKIN